MVAIQEKYQAQEHQDEWWAYSRVHGWVVLDKGLPRNRMSHMPEQFEFVRCNDWTVYEQGEQTWSYQEARRYLNELPAGQAHQAEKELARLQEEFEAKNRTE